MDRDASSPPLNPSLIPYEKLSRKILHLTGHVVTLTRICPFVKSIFYPLRLL